MISAEDLIRKAERDRSLAKEEIVALLTLPAGPQCNELLSAADRVREKEMGDAVQLRGLIEFSSCCRRHCRYCGLRAGNARATRYRILPDEIVKIARRGKELGYGTVVLQSGEDPWYTVEILCRIIHDIKAMGLAVTLSIGERPLPEYKAMKEAGADRFLLRHETADPELYARLHPDGTLAERLACLSCLRELGYQVGAGCMVGLPGQTPDMLAEDLLLMKRLDVEMAGIGPFIPHPETPLAQSAAGTVEMTLKMVALARLLIPKVHLPATTALGSIDPYGRQKALLAGANVVMPNITPLPYRKAYEIYPGKICTGDDAAHCRGCIEGIIKSLNRTIGQGPGHSPKFVVR